MKKLIKYFSIAIILLNHGCVSKLKYKRDLLKTKEETQKEFVSLVESKNIQIQELSSKIEKMSLGGGEVPDASKFIPLIPVPPPQPSDYETFDNTILNKYKTYGDVNNYLDKILKTAGYRNYVYMPTASGGFAIAIPVEEINTNGDVLKKVDKTPYTLATFFRKLFSQEHIDELFFSEKGYYRCILFIVSPNLYTVNGPRISYLEIQNWLYQNYISLPSKIAETPLAKDAKLLALLYEFEQNENTENKIQILNSKNCVTKLSSLEIIKNIKR